MIKAEQAKIQARLREMEGEVGNNQAMINGIRDIQHHSRTIHDCRYDVGGFVAATIAARTMSGLLWGWHWWWGPWGMWAPGYVNIHVGYWHGFVDGLAYDWALVDAYADLALLDELAVREDLAVLEAMEVQGALEDLEALEQIETLSEIQSVAETAEAIEWLQAGQIEMEAAEMLEITESLEQGWDDFAPADTGEVLEEFSSDMGDALFDRAMEMEVFDDAVMDFLGDW